MDREKLISFLRHGKGLYLEGTAYAYNNSDNDLFNKLGCTYVGPGVDTTTNLNTLKGQANTIVSNVTMEYLPECLTNYWISEIDGGKARLLFKCEKDKGRTSSYEGVDERYRTIHSSVLFGALRDENKRNKLMKIYMKYLLSGSNNIGRPLRKNRSIHGFSCDSRLLQHGKLHYTLHKNGQFATHMYTLLGKKVFTLRNNKMKTGDYQYTLPKNLGDGMYLLTITFDKETTTIPILYNR